MLAAKMMLRRMLRSAMCPSWPLQRRSFVWFATFPCISPLAPQDSATIVNVENKFIFIHNSYRPTKKIVHNSWTRLRGQRNGIGQDVIGFVFGNVWGVLCTKTSNRRSVLTP
jgi:hypothetical protein